MNVIKDKVLKLTQIGDYNQALTKMINDYLQLKIRFLSEENKRFESKFNMTFANYEKQTAKDPKSAGYTTEQEYYSWSEIVTELDYYKKLHDQWN